MKSWFIFAISLSLLAVLAPGSRAEVAQIDREFMEAHTAELKLLTEEALNRPLNPGESLDVIRELLSVRSMALMELHQQHPLTSLDGIETQDAYDGEVVHALHQVALAGVQADTTLPPQEHAIRFNEVMGDVPDLGEAPVGFMVATLAGVTLATADTLTKYDLLPPDSVDKLAVRLVFYGTSRYERTHADLFLTSQADGFRQNSVIARLRCPNEGATYRVADLKNKLGPEGGVSTIYKLKCNACDAPFDVSFPLELTSRLNKAADRQKLKQEPTPRTPTNGLDP